MTKRLILVGVEKETCQYVFKLAKIHLDDPHVFWNNNIQWMEKQVITCCNGPVKVNA